MEIIDLKRSENELTRVLSLSATFRDKGLVTNISINSSHPRWASIQELVSDYQNGYLSREDFAEQLNTSINVVNTLRDRFERVSGVLDGRMTIKGNSVFVDHEKIDPVMEEYILNILKENDEVESWGAFGKFVEKLYSNENSDVRRQLYGWLSHELNNGGFTLTEDGDLIGYKGCSLGDEGTPYSIFTGSAIVDGTPVSGKIPNKIGSIIEMPRGSVTSDPEVGCSTGLHVGTYSYASSFQRGILLVVKVNPRDIVSVPTECSAQKMRVCRYEVLEARKEKIQSFVTKTRAPQVPVAEIVVTSTFKSVDSDDLVEAKFPVAGRYEVKIGQDTQRDTEYFVRLFPKNDNWKNNSVDTNEFGVIKFAVKSQVFELRARNLSNGGRASLANASVSVSDDVDNKNYALVEVKTQDGDAEFIVEVFSPEE